MSEFTVEVVRLGKIGKHPNADTLSISQVCGRYPVIFRTGDYQPGDLAVYVPVDSVVPKDDERWSFLDGHRRIKARRLRGIFSMGLLTPAEPGMVEGQYVREVLRIEKYVPPREAHYGMQGQMEPDPGILPVYDLEGLRRWPDVLHAGEEVVVTEKIHGCNGRWVHDGTRLWVGSHRTYKRHGHGDVWWQIAEKYSLEEKLAAHPRIALFGEVYGPCQDLDYGSPKDPRLALFDAMRLDDHQFLGWDEFVTLVLALDLPRVPMLYRGPWDESALTPLANGPSTIANHMREGFVVKPAVERWDARIGRVAMKLVGEDYLLRKAA